MGQNVKRILIAAVLSAFCLLLNNMWYFSLATKPKARSGQEPIARLSSNSDQVLRKQTDRLIWESIGLNEPLFWGEAIRTSSESEAEIRFLESNLVIALEPSSVIVLEKQGDKISLGLLEGQLFAKSESSSQPSNVILRAGESQLSLGGAEVSVGRSDKGLDLQVLRGTVEVKTQGDTRKLEQGSAGILNALNLETVRSLKVVSPLMDDTVYVTDGQPMLDARFRPIGGNYTYELWGGTKRESLSVLPQQRVEEGRITAPVKAGKYIWQVVAKNESGTVKGPIMRSFFRLLLPPQILVPQKEQTLTLSRQDPTLNLEWTNRGQLQDLKLEVFKLKTGGREAASTLVSEVVGSQTSRQQRFSEPGRYAMRISGRGQRGGAALNTVQTFQVALVDAKDLRAPSSVPDVRIEPVTFWRDSVVESDVEYATAQPQLDLLWTQTAGARSWRLRIAEEKEAIDSKPWVSAMAPRYQQALAQPGRYRIQMEVLGADKQVVARAPEKFIRFTQALPPPAPEWKPGKWTADSQGDVTIQWNPSQRAQRYMVVLQKNGQEFRKFNLTQTQLTLDALPPGTLSAQVQAVDNLGRMSAPSESKEIEVPNSSAVRAPAFKKIKVQ